MSFSIEFILTKLCLVGISIRLILFTLSTFSGYEAVCSFEGLVAMYARTNWYRPKNMPIGEEYGVDEPTNNLTSKDASTYAQISASKNRLVFKNGFNFTFSFQN